MCSLCKNAQYGFNHAVVKLKFLYDKLFIQIKNIIIEIQNNNSVIQLNYVNILFQSETSRSPFPY
jgi:hypothetical protein